jgi:hypothetical protein
MPSFVQSKDFWITVAAFGLTVYLLVTHQLTTAQAALFMGGVLAVLRGSSAIETHADSTVKAAQIRAGTTTPPPAAPPPPP